MRWALALGLLVVGCKGEPRGPKLVTRIPHVNTADVVATDAPDSLPPPVVVVVGADDRLLVAAGPARWSGLTTYAPPATMKETSSYQLDHVISEANASGKRARDQLAEFGKQPPATRGQGAPGEHGPDPHAPVSVVDPRIFDIDRGLAPS